MNFLGPWTASGSCVTNADEEIIMCSTIGWCQREDHIEDYELARFVAAAPDLLNALSALADVAEQRGIPVDAARAAIAKAKGAA